MYLLEVVLNPLDKVIFECAFDDLMEKVGGKEFVNIRAWEPHHEWLRSQSKCAKNIDTVVTYLEVGNDPVIIP